MRADERAVDRVEFEERDPGWPRVRWETLERYADFLVCLSGGPKGEVGRWCASGRPDRAEAVVRRYLDLFGTDRYRVEVQRHLAAPGEDAAIGKALALARRLGVEAVATNDVHYLTPDDADLHDVMRAIRRLAPLEADGPLNAERYLKRPLEMRALFRDAPEVVRATERLAAEAVADIGLGSSCLPHYVGLEPGESAVERLRIDARRGLGSRGLDTAQARARLADELDVIARRGFESYFLVVADIVAEVKARGIRVSCRGSGVGSLVCYALGISEVDPLRHGLLFERFLSMYRDELPDIDLDVESHRREEVLTYLLRSYGAGRMGMACMFETFQARHAIRDVGKALGLPPADLDEIAKAFPYTSARSIPKVRETLPELRDARLNGAEVERLLSVASRLDGFPRHLALHPSGVLLASVDLDTRTPLQPSFARFPMSQHDKDDVDALGLLKLDVIGVRMLSAMGHAVREVARVSGERVDLDALPRDDPDTYEMVQVSDTLGCFQIESPGQRELVTKLLPSRFDDLIVDISLFRPGPVKADMVTPYLRRRMGLEPPVYVHPEMRPILAETHGVVVFHEQVMRILSVFSGMSLGEADAFRRAMGSDGDDLSRLRERFCSMARAQGHSDPQRLWHEVESFASFGFCKAHAAAFAVPTYQSAWLKRYHPAAFYAGVLTHDPGMYPRRAILADARRHGIPILPLDAERSAGEYRVEETPDAQLAIRLGLKDVKGITDEEVQALQHERPYDSVEDLLRRTRIRRPVAEALCEAGALDRFGPRRLVLLEIARVCGGGLLAGVKGAAHEMREMGVRPAAAARRAPSGDHPTLFEDGAFGPIATLVGEGVGLWRARDLTEAEKVRAELEVLGLDASRHVIAFYEHEMRRLGCTPASELPKLRSGTTVTVAGVKVATQTPPVRSGRRVIFLTLDDPSGLADAVVFPDAQDRCARTVFRAWLVAVRGELRRTGRVGASVVVSEAWDLTELARSRSSARAPAPAGHGRGRGRLYHASGGSSG